ncbi:MAG TPA: acetate/propionate family kinase [Tepidisphaeraceae bacterium]|jgi:acetate kinase|nr:acetate/propionate family kinase [Tepidisphaeraceae bacterium]
MPPGNAKTKSILTINGGSSSIKFAVYSWEDALKLILKGQVERIGQSGTSLSGKMADSSEADRRDVDAADHRAAAEQIVGWIEQKIGRGAITAIGHRVVHGGIHLLEHQRVTPELLAELRRTQPLDLAHLPREIALIEAMAERFPGIPQVACFDTAFHRDMPRVAKLLPIPRKYDAAGLRRFGFHGLSYAYLMAELRQTAGDAAADGRVILAHLGNGASMAAVKGGKLIDTTMAFTPLAGLVMGTRPGDLDPGLLVYLMRVEKVTPEQMDEFLNHDCGLKGISQTSSDMRDLAARRATDVRAAEAVELFCYRARQWIGALAASMGGVDTLILSGGIGEHAADVRAEICAGLEFLGIAIDAGKNQSNAEIISVNNSAVTIRIIATDEEIMIAQLVSQICSWVQPGAIISNTANEW